MAYSTGMMKYRVQVAKRATDESATFGKSGQPKYIPVGTFWMAETFTKGIKALHEGALDAYDTVMFRCRFIRQLDRWCLLKFKGKWYQITSFNDDYQDNQIQITATEMANQQVNVMKQVHEVEIWGNHSFTKRPDGERTTVFAQFNTDIRGTVTFQNSQYTLSIVRDYQNRMWYVSFGEDFAYEWESADYIHADTEITLISQETVLMDKDSDYSFGDLIWI